MSDRDRDDRTATDRGGRSDDDTSVDGDDTAADGDDTAVDGEDVDGTRRGDSSDGGFSFTLPPIRLPPFFPEDFRLLWPAAGERLRGRVSRRVVLAALVAFDLVDALLAAATDSGVVAGTRVLAGALVAATTFGTLGVAYVWEAAAVLFGAGALTAVPTLSLLLVARALRDVL